MRVKASVIYARFYYVLVDCQVILGWIQCWEYLIRNESQATK